MRSTGTISKDITEIWPGVLLIAYFTVTGVRIALGEGRAEPMVLAAHVVLLALALACILTRAIPRWIVDWLPMMAVPFMYAELPTVIAAVGHTTTFDATIERWETALFSGAPSVDWARTWSAAVVNETLHAAYASYYLIIFSVPALLYVRGRRRDFSEAVFVVLLSFVSCLLVYSEFPVAGPRYRTIEPLPGAIRVGVLWLLEFGSARGTAFPSSHVAVAVTQSILATRYFGARGTILWIPTIGLSLGAVYGGFHYAVDVIAGFILGSGVSAIGILLLPRLRVMQAPQANATAPM